MKTEILKITDKKAIPRAVEILNEGGIVIYPTETVYGIGADAGNIPKRKASTVFDTIEMKIVREGPISEKHILAALKS